MTGKRDTQLAGCDGAVLQGMVIPPVVQRTDVGKRLPGLLRELVLDILRCPRLP